MMNRQAVKITYIFEITRKPYTYPLRLKRVCASWEDVLREFPDAKLLGAY